MGQALALVQFRRYQDARDRLSGGRECLPAERAFAHALARLLAAAPDDRVRNGQRALTLVQDMLRNQQPTPDVGETMAMALAEVGQYSRSDRTPEGADRRRRESWRPRRRPAPRGPTCAATSAANRAARRGVKRSFAEHVLPGTRPATDGGKSGIPCGSARGRRRRVVDSAHRAQSADRPVELVGLVCEHLPVDARPSARSEQTSDLVEREAGVTSQRDQCQPLQHARIEETAQPAPADRRDQSFLLIEPQRRSRSSRAPRHFGDIHVFHPLTSSRLQLA